MFVIYYKSKYSPAVLNDQKFLEIVHPGSVLMTGMFSCMFCLPKDHPDMFFFWGSRMFVMYLKFKYSSDMFSCILCMFCFPKSIQICFFLGSNVCDLLQI